MPRNSRNLDLFPELVKPRAKPRVLMHVSDAGTASCGHASDLGKPLCRMLCGHCGLESDWVVFDTVSEAKCGVACPRCNPTGTTGMLPAQALAKEEAGDEEGT